MRDYTAIIDTGFNGFVALPLLEMVPLGLSTDPAAASVMLGNGDAIYNLVAQGSVALGGRSETGSILLDETTTDVLVGMALLRTFKLALIVTDTAVVLHDRREALEVIAQLMQTAPSGLPNSSPLAAGADDE
jgi:predicted aspartyl protease